MTSYFVTTFLRCAVLPLCAVLLLCAVPCLADVRLPKVLGSKMVLQRDSDVKIWGWADPGEDVEVAGEWLRTKASGRADTDGKWQVRIPTGKAGGPHTITITGKNTVQLDDILFGEVWIGSGQSNMEMPLVETSRAYTGIKDSAREVAEATYPEIRLFQAGNFSSKEALEDVEGGQGMYGIPPAPCKWQVCTPETIPTFASTAYFFARGLYKELQIPIGIIDSSWGGTSAEAWTPLSGLKKLESTSALEKATQLPQDPAKKIPSRLYNGMIHPLRNLTIQGVVWYQGEGNASRADKYRELFSTMISEWRAAFAQDFSFYFVQIAPFNYGDVNSAYLREAQLETLALPKTGMAVTLDIANLTDIHPKNKQEVGRRLALWALANDYGSKLAYSGPLYRESVFKDGKARLKFDHVGSGLVTRDGKPPNHFEIAGADKVFHSASVVLDGETLVVASESVSEPKAVRYAFTTNAEPNLMNKEGLPASSFRTDRW